MGTIEIIGALAGAVGLAEIVKLLIEKRFSKKRDNTKNQRDEFAILRERIDFNEKEINRVNRSQIAANRKMSRMYSFLVDFTKQTCSEENCALRKVVSIDFDAFEDDDDDEIYADPKNNEMPVMPDESQFEN